MYTQDILNSGLLPYAPYYGALPPGTPFLIDPRLMHEYAAAAANNEQMKGFQRQKMILEETHLTYFRFSS